jgi:hypothetical protein
MAKVPVTIFAVSDTVRAEILAQALRGQGLRRTWTGHSQQPQLADQAPLSASESTSQEVARDEQTLPAA